MQNFRTERLLQQHLKRTDNFTMSIDTSVMAELQEAADSAAKGIRDPEAMRKALSRMTATREEIRTRLGTIDVAVDLIGSARDQ
jgi:hypothetical protein